MTWGIWYNTDGNRSIAGVNIVCF